MPKHFVRSFTNRVFMVEWTYQGSGEAGVMGMSLKRRIKRAAAWALAFTIAVPFVSFGAAAAQESARETGWYA